MKPARSMDLLRIASGEQMLLLTIFGREAMKRLIDRELSRRALLRRQMQQTGRASRRAA